LTLRSRLQPFENPSYVVGQKQKIRAIPIKRESSRILQPLT